MCEQPKTEIDIVIGSLRDFIAEKNRRYGASALNPINIFSSHIKYDSPKINGILTRLDDKLSRIKNSDSLRENDVVDTIGYLVLLCVANGWNDFTHLLD